MTEQTRKLLDKANRAVHAAETLLREGDSDFAAGRAYYAMFYAAVALLIEKGLRFRKHGSVHAAFGEHFSKGEVLDPKYHRWLLDAYDQRILGDYGVESTLTREDVERMIEQAREFLSNVHRYLELKP
ncbi:MAG: HEPN domain-containing protein [bacterium]